MLRLPGDVRPVSERLELKLDPSKPRYSGAADIVVQLERERRVVWLHGRGLHVTSATVAPEGGRPAAAAWTERDEHGMSSLTLASPAPAGRATLHIEFDAPLSDKRLGLFRAAEAGVDYAFTQLEPTYAREVFPCFDEPGFKIPWSLALVIPGGATAVANTPEEGRTAAADGATRVTFAQSKPLPSYLVAFAVGPLDIVPAPDVPPNTARAHALPLRIVAPRGHAVQLAYALIHSGEILATLEQYFGIAYPYEKLDLIVVPNGSGAMENPGAVTFDEPLLTFDEKAAPVWQKRAYAYVTAHELAHQWFGDLVTMKWWDDTWLNESFATWMGSKAADAWQPASEARLNLLDGVQGAISTDSLQSARAVRQPVESIDDIQNAFDETTYEKGGGVLTMFERWLGEKTFREGVRLHLSRHAYGSATADDFLSALSTAAGRDVATPMRTFLERPGVPYVETELRCDGSPRLHLTQSRFLPAGSKGDAAGTWQVPVCAHYAAGAETKEACVLLTEREGDLALDAPACPAWVLPNADAAGYYRFGLAPNDLAKLRTAGMGVLSPGERVALGNSLRAAFHRGSAPFGEALRTAAMLAGDTNALAASEPQAFVDLAYDWLAKDRARPAIEAYARKLYAAPFAKLGWTHGAKDDPQTLERRADIVRFLANVAQDRAVRAEARRRALAFLGIGKDGAVHRDAVDADLVGIVLGVAGQEATPAQFDAMLAHLAKTDDQVLRGQLIDALASARDPALSLRARDLTLDPRVRPAELTIPIHAQMRVPETREAMWAWLKQHWDAVWARAAGSVHIAHRLMGTPSAFCDDPHAADAASFLGDRARTMEGATRELAKSLERVSLCANRRAAEEDHARVFFTTGK
jgi:alanyl aminopeptidase